MPPKRKATSPPSGGKQMKKRNQSEKENHPAVTDDEGIDRPKTGKIKDCNKNEEKGFMTFKGKIESPELLDEKDKKKDADFPNLELNQLLQQKSRLNMQGSIKWKTFLLPPLPKSTSSAEPTHSYFGLDLVDEDTGRTHWTHKASVWKDVFESIFEVANIQRTSPISPKFEGILACPVRAVPNGPNDIKTFKTSKSRFFQHWIMLVPIPSNMDCSQFIPAFLKEFKELYKMTFIKSAYKSGVGMITTHEGLMNQISYDGNYWKVLDNATEKELMFESFHYLSELLLDYNIRSVVSKTFGVEEDPSTWPDAVKNYAFAN